jgi:hypothetical protein
VTPSQVMPSAQHVREVIHTEHEPADTDSHGMADNEAVQPRRRAVVRRLERHPLQSYQDKQEREDERRCGYDGKRRESAPGSG